MSSYFDVLINSKEPIYVEVKLKNGDKHIHENINYMCVDMHSYRIIDNDNTKTYIYPVNAISSMMYDYSKWYNANSGEK